ncbi:MAG TPA: DUF4145 domain-containing protein [Alloacidobacterium sp.]|nr:DUF4145 domain-containing protein [Alloacidobacterium sp.]
MASEFSVALARFVELYRHDPWSVASFLDGDFSSETLEVDKNGNREAELTIAKRTLIDTPDVNSLLRLSLDSFSAVEAKDITYEHWYRSQEVWNVDLNFIAEFFAEKLGKSPEEALHWIFNEVRKSQADTARKPDFNVLFTLRFASQLDTMVEKLNGLDDLTCSEILSNPVRKLLQEAHDCFLHGLEAASAITCGAALEETLKEVLPHCDERWDLGQLLQDAKESSLLSDDEWGMGDDVREFRNLAAHNPKEFSRRSQVQKISLLSNTRAVVEILLREKQES